MKSTYVLFSLMLSVLVTLSGCFNPFGGGNDKNEGQEEVTMNEENGDENTDSPEQDEIENIGDAMKSLRNAVKELNGGKEVKTVDFRDLKELMPNKIAGIERTSNKGERTGMAGFNFSTANAEYKDGDSRFKVDIIDAAGIGMLVNSMAAWTLMDVDRESDDEYERTTTIDGYKAYEKYNSAQQRGQISLFIEDRFIVNIEGWNVSAKDLRKAVESIDLDDLKKLI